MKPTTIFFSGIRLSATFLLAIIFTGCVKNIGDGKSNIVATSVDNQAGPGDPTQPGFTTFKKVATKQLSNYRSGVVAAGAGSKVLFAGGSSLVHGTWNSHSVLIKERTAITICYGPILNMLL